jgi:hypothetical protein
MPGTSLNVFPLTVSVTAELWVSVCVKPVQSSVPNDVLAVIVQFPGELASKNTSSAEPGTDAPDAPPDEVDHEPVLFQFVPLPTKKRDAT